MKLQRGDGGARGHCLCLCPAWASSGPRLPLSPQVVYTERYENKQEHDQSSINLIRCSYLGAMDMSETTSEEQIPYTVSSTSQKNVGQGYEDTEKAWLPSNVSRTSSLPPPEPSESLAQSRSRSVIVPYSDSGVQLSTHTIILDFSMVHYVDSQASVVLRQVSTTETWP